MRSWLSRPWSEWCACYESARCKLLTPEQTTQPSNQRIQGSRNGSDRLRLDFLSMLIFLRLTVSFSWFPQKIYNDELKAPVWCLCCTVLFKIKWLVLYSFVVHYYHFCTLCWRHKINQLGKLFFEAKCSDYLNGL